MSPGQHSLDAAQMPRYQSHKKVWALQIKSTHEETDPTGQIYKFVVTPVETGYAAFDVPVVMLSRYKPVPGDYFVTYEDGYASFSPQKAFEEGYTRL